MSVIVTAVFHPLADRRQELVAALRTAIPAVHEEPGCLLYAIHDASDGTVTMIEKWSSADDLATHADGSAVVALNAAIDGLLDRPVVVTTMSAIPAGTAAQGRL